jgi:ADP-ribose pyrophosphatase
MTPCGTGAAFRMVFIMPRTAKKGLMLKEKLFNFFNQNRTLPNGHKTQLQFIEHPGAVMIIPMINKTRIIILRQYRPVIKRYLYEFPAGTLEKHEKPLTCARRELIEETGYGAKRWTNLGKIYPVPGYSTEMITVFKAEELYTVGEDHEPDEIIEMYTTTRKELKDMVRSGKIIDAKTICGMSLMEWLPKDAKG